MRICYFFTISLCLRVTNTIKIITGAGGMQSPFSASIHGWSCAVLAQKTENPGQTETFLSPWQWLILCVPAQFLKAIRILHNPCYKTVDTHELLYIHLSTCLPSDNSVKIIFVKWGTRVVSFLGILKPCAIGLTPNMQGNKTAGERRKNCTRIIVLRKPFSL